MKRSILTIVAAVAFVLGAAAQTAQTQYVMQIKKTNGEIIPVNADEIADVSFVSAQASVRTLMQQGIQEAAKSLAGRINFTGLKTLTSINQQLLLAMENTPKFATTVQTMLALAAEANPKAVEEGNPLAQYGFETYSELVPELLRFRVVLKGDEAFAITTSEAMEFVFPAVIPSTSQTVDMTLSIKSVGENMKTVIPSIKNPKKAMIYYLPEKFELTMTADVAGQKLTVFTGELNNKVTKAVAESPYVNLLTDNVEITGKFQSHIKGFEQYGIKDDKNVISFGLGFDMIQKKQKIAFGFEQEDIPLVSINSETSFTETPKLIQGLMQGNLKELISTLDLGNAISTGSLADIVASFINGRSLDKLSINLLGRLELNISCSDELAFLQQVKAMIQAHRDRKTKEEVDAYSKAMNQLLKISVKVISSNVGELSLPVEIQTELVGVDYVALPAIKFPDEQDYTPVSSLIETETLKYAMNIVSHSFTPVSDAVKTTISMATTVLGIVFGGTAE